MRLSTKLSLGGFYTLSYADADTNGNSAGLVMNPYDIRQDYGRAAFDVRNRAVLIGNWNLPHRVSLSPFLVASSGSPFNINVGQDLFGTGTFNARPALAAAGTGARVPPPPHHHHQPRLYYAARNLQYPSHDRPIHHSALWLSIIPGNSPLTFG